MPSDPHPHIHTEIEPLGDTGRLAQVTVDNPTRLNVLDSDLIRQLRAAIRALEPDRQLRCVVLRGAGDRAFIGGADISEFGKPPMEPFLPNLCNRIEASPLLVVASMRRHYFIGALRKAKIPSVLSPYAVCSAAALSRISCGVELTTSA